MSLRTAILQLYVYSGTEGAQTSSDLKYTIEKEIIDGDTKILFEIGELVRDYIDITFNNDYVCNTKWVTAITTLYDENNEIFTYSNPVTNHYLALNGYGYFEDEINPQLSTDALVSSTYMYIPESTTSKIGVWAEGVGKVTIDGSDTEITDNGNSNQKIQYVTIPANSSTIQVYDTHDSSILKTINITNVCEPKFTPYKITFVNKLGAYENIWFFKKSTESLSVTDEKFKRNTINNSTVTYNTYEGQQERYNVNGLTSLSLNTGFVNEDLNKTIEELFLSENVWIRYENKTQPIIPKSKSFVFKTKLNDKLINHTVDFEFAFNKINNVR
tara:strand:- start:633 stop:1619 length:987 start_codon:yes stop_codon:yes gene_type:complete